MYIISRRININNSLKKDSRNSKTNNPRSIPPIMAMTDMVDNIAEIITITANIEIVTFEKIFSFEVLFNLKTSSSYGLNRNMTIISNTTKLKWVLL